MSQGPTAPPFGILSVVVDHSLTGGGTSLAPGTPVLVTTSGTLDRSEANDPSVDATIGLAIKGGTSGLAAEVQFAGPVALSADQWDDITGGSGGLVAGTSYYVSSDNPGQLVNAKPVGGGTYTFKVGIALNANVLFLELGGSF